MREYWRTRRGIALFLAAYFAGGMLTLLNPTQEVFPVFSWFLFALVPPSLPQYGLLIEDVNGRRVDPPRLYQEAEGIISTPHEIIVYQLTQQLGAAIERHPQDADRYREVLEKNWLPSATRYEVVRINADPIARWKSGHYDMQSLKTFTSVPSSP
jgi:hypothetical protein